MLPGCDAELDRKKSFMGRQREREQRQKKGVYCL